MVGRRNIGTRSRGTRGTGTETNPTRSASRTRSSRDSRKLQDSSSERRAARNSQRLERRANSQSLPEDGSVYTSARLGDMRRAQRAEENRARARKFIIRLVVAVALVASLGVGVVVLYNSDAFAIENVTVTGVEHLTNDEMAQMAAVPDNTTLLRVDIDTIKSRLKKNAWVQDVEVKRVFPNTLEIDVTERTVTAIVEIPAGKGGKKKSWAIASDHTWLMPIPEPDSEAAKTTSSKIYEDAEQALHITDVPYGTKAEIGSVCTDNNVNNALDIVAGMTTSLADQVVTVSAAGPAETTRMLDNGVEIAFGKAEDVRDKERVILKILEDNPDGVAYINVRIVESPTWRSI